MDVVGMVVEWLYFAVAVAFAVWAVYVAGALAVGLVIGTVQWIQKVRRQGSLNLKP